MNSPAVTLGSGGSAVTHEAVTENETQWRLAGMAEFASRSIALTQGFRYVTESWQKVAWLRTVAYVPTVTAIIRR